MHPKPYLPITTRCPFPTAYKYWKWLRAVETCRYSLNPEASISYILTTVRICSSILSKFQGLHRFCEILTVATILGTLSSLDSKDQATPTDSVRIQFWRQQRSRGVSAVSDARSLLTERFESYLTSQPLAIGLSSHHLNATDLQASPTFAVYNPARIRTVSVFGPHATCLGGLPKNAAGQGPALQA